jgi:hypothetical protein
MVWRKQDLHQKLPLARASRQVYLLYGLTTAQIVHKPRIANSDTRPSAHLLPGFYATAEAVNNTVMVRITKLRSSRS